MIVDSQKRELFDSFSVEDVTDNSAGLALAFGLLRAGYRALTSNMISLLELDETVCHDAYHCSGLSRTLLLTGLNPQTSTTEPLGTLRITPSSELALKYGLAPIEAMSLMVPPEGWGRFRFEGFDATQIVEGGRIALSAPARVSANKERKLPELILYKLVRTGFEIAAKDFGKTQYWGILPSYMIRRFDEAGIHVIPAPQVQLRQERWEFFEKYERYWLKNDPCFCKVRVKGICG